MQSVELQKFFKGKSSIAVEVEFENMKGDNETPMKMKFKTHFMKKMYNHEGLPKLGNERL
jgi:hypothetical protein